MSMDFLKNTYRPSMPKDTKSRTSYSQMNSWMHIPPMEKKHMVQVNTHDVERYSRYHGPQAVAKPPRMGKATSYDRECIIRNILAEEWKEPLQDETEYTSRYARHVNETKRTQSEVRRGKKEKKGQKKGSFGCAHNSPPPVHLQYYKSGGYDDAHKAYLNLAKQKLAKSFPHYGPPRLRNGHVGGSWRHLKEVLQAGGKRIVFVDGQISTDDRHKSEKIPHGDMIRPVIRKHMHEAHTDLAYCPPAPKPKKRDINQLQNLTAYMDVNTLRSIERNNWSVMR